MCKRIGIGWHEASLLTEVFDWDPEDLAFYRHELAESQYMSEQGTSYDEAHMAALEEEGVPCEDSDEYLYHPDVREEHSEWFSRGQY